MVESRDNMTGTPYVAPVGDVALAVAGIWADVLGVDRVGARDDFYDFAGTSMNAVAICARLRDELKIEVSPEAVRETASLEDFVKELEAAAGADTGADLLTWFARSVAAYPDEPAVVCGEDSITYDELDAWSRTLAARLRSVGDAVPQRVGLWATRSFADYAGYLAILRIGATVVPVSPDFPRERTARICESAQLDAIIGRDEDDLPESVREGEPDLPDLPTVSPSPDDVAYILFTSGSTGNPKGVPISHRNVSAYLAHVFDRYALGPGSRLSQTFALTFDPSVFDVFAALSTGATAVLPRPGDLMDPVRYVTEQGITHWFSVPSLISVARQLSKLDASSMPDLRVSTFIGEQLTREQAEAWAAAAPGSIVENVYGPTEVTVACTVYQLPADWADWPETDNATIPIGLPHRDTDVAITEDGELLLRGPQRFAGYLQAEDDQGRFLPEGGPITAEHWYRTGDRVQRLDDGSLVHRGRLDTQVKLNGFRMELGEIEGALRADQRVVDCVVVVIEKLGEAPALHAAYSGEWIAPREIIADLRTTLPDYMVPRRFTRLDDVPRNANGKTDRRAVLRLLEG
jgi:amino acid adenylation domain-containing protein